MKNKNYLNISLEYIVYLNCSITAIQGGYPLNFIIEDDKFEVSTEKEKLFTGVFSNVEERVLFLNFFKSVVNSFKYSSKNLKPKVKGFLSLARKNDLRFVPTDNSNLNNEKEPYKISFEFNRTYNGKIINLDSLIYFLLNNFGVEEYDEDEFPF